MTSGTGAVRRGLVAGAVGTTVLNAVTYLDMVVRGRPSSDLPRQTVERGLDRLDLELSGSSEERADRAAALGAMSGIAAGLGVGLAVSSGRAMGLRLSPLAGGVVTAAAAMTATSGPAAVLGVTNLKAWTVEEWAADTLPHLAYGVVTHHVVRGLERRDPGLAQPTRPSVGLVTRSLLLGVATGCRSSLGLVAAASSAPRSPRSRRAGVMRAAAALAVAGELVGDKLPQTPSRLERTGLGARFLSATVGGTALASRENAVADLPVAAAAVGAAVGAIAGAAWREATVARPVQAALVEDVVALALAGAACRRS